MYMRVYFCRILMQKCVLKSSLCSSLKPVKNVTKKKGWTTSETHTREVSLYQPSIEFTK